VIIEVRICRCPNCDSLDIVKNGTDYKGDQKYHCHYCGGYGTLHPTARYSQTEKEQVLKAYQERVSMRGIGRIFGVVPKTLLRWIKEALAKLPSLGQSVAPARFDDVLELDELWSFVLKKSNKRWIWIALSRRTRQVIAYYVGDRSESSCRQLWQRIPEDYKSCASYSDFWTAYQKVLPAETHQAVGKQSGQTAHVERWNNTLRQRLARFVRKTLSFSKSEFVHDLVLRFFIINYNLQCSISQ
jgi:insertion element IS1 protein InsB